MANSENNLELYRKRKLQCLIYSLILATLSMPGVSLAKSSVFPIDLSPVNFKIVLLFFFCTAIYQYVNWFTEWEGEMLKSYHVWISKFSPHIENFDEIFDIYVTIYRQTNSIDIYDDQIYRWLDLEWIDSFYKKLVDGYKERKIDEGFRGIYFYSGIIFTTQFYKYKHIRMKDIILSEDMSLTEFFNELIGIKLIGGRLGRSKAMKRTSHHYNIKVGKIHIIRTSLLLLMQKHYLLFRKVISKLRFWLIEFWIPSGLCLIALSHAIGKIWPSFGFLPNLPSLLNGLGIITAS